jgi:hypothetical protein
MDLRNHDPSIACDSDDLIAPIIPGLGPNSLRRPVAEWENIKSEIEKHRYVRRDSHHTPYPLVLFTGFAGPESFGSASNPTKSSTRS